MRWALIGDDEIAAEVARAAADDATLTCVAVYESSYSPPTSDIVVHQRGRDWESLLQGNRVDFVIVGGGESERRHDQLVRLTQVALPVLVTPAACRSATIAYQLDMIRAETRSPIVPAWPRRSHPGAEILAELARSSSGALGTIERVEIEHATDDLSRDAVLQGFAEDADLVRMWLGDVTRLGAMGPPRAETPTELREFTTLTVNLWTAGQSLVRWSLKRSPQRQTKFTLVGERGEATLTIPAGSNDWKLQLPDSAANVPTFLDWRPGEIALANIRAALAGQTTSPDWLQIARAIDLAETIEPSLRRGRNIDIYNESFTEAASFKGAMGIAGCGLLLFGLFSVIGVAMAQMIARQAGWHNVAEVLGRWPWLLAAIFVLFLLLQLLKLAIPPSEPPPPAESSGATPS